jgi:hypothetical protein
MYSEAGNDYYILLAGAADEANNTPQVVYVDGAGDSYVDGVGDTYVEELV